MRYFCLEFDISSEEVRTVTGGSISDVGPISPCINVLPMGFSWSFFLVQHIHQSAVLRSLSISEQDLFLDGRPPPHISSSGIYSMPYCDNIHSISSDKSSCNEGKQRIVSELAGQGFTIHEEEDASTLFNTLGGVVDGDSGRVGMTSRRAWDLIYAFEYVAERVVSREVVQKLLGHAMFFSTINRGGMSVFRRLYDFVEHCKVPRRLTSQERQECLVFAGLIPLLFADLRKQWSNTLFCTDASPDGYGVCCREVERSTAESLGRWNERWRFKRLGPEEWHQEGGPWDVIHWWKESQWLVMMGSMTQSNRWGLMRTFRRSPWMLLILLIGEPFLWGNGDRRRPSLLMRVVHWFFAYAVYVARAAAGASNMWFWWTVFLLHLQFTRVVLGVLIFLELLNRLLHCL